jgi:hypothetical protein
VRSQNDETTKRKTLAETLAMTNQIGQREPYDGALGKNNNPESKEIRVAEMSHSLLCHGTTGKRTT